MFPTRGARLKLATPVRPSWLANTPAGSGTTKFSDLSSLNFRLAVTNIDAGALLSYSALESILIPNSVTESEADAFHECNALKHVDIPESVTSIGDPPPSQLVITIYKRFIPAAPPQIHNTPLSSSKHVNNSAAAAALFPNIQHTLQAQPSLPSYILDGEQ